MFGTSVKEGDVYKFVLSTTTKRFYSDNNEFGVYDFITEDDIPVEDNAVPMLFGNDEKRINRGVIAGTTGELENGIYYDVEAEVVYNQKFDSWQYKPIKIIPLVPTDIDKSRKFLQSVITKAQTDALLNKYPDIIDKIMNGDKIDLKNIKGVKDKSFVKIEEKIKKTYGMMDLVVFLRPLGVTIKTIEKLFKSGTSSSVIKKKLIENPYILTRIDGFGFKRADEIALKIAPHIVCSEFRTQSFMVNLLNDVANQYGHTWVNTGKFLEECRRNIPECKNYVMATLENGSNSIFYIDKESKRIALQKNRRLESSISQELKRLLNGSDEFLYNDVSKTINNIEKSQMWDFTDEQLDGVQLIQDNNVIAVTGGAGSGKTSVATAMTKILEDYSVVQVALSGRAALRIKNVTGVDSSTIHRLLKFKDSAFVYNENNKLPHDVIVIDEASMIGASLFNSLLCAIKTGAKLIVMGDVDQLDSIGVGSVFKDMLDSGVIPKVRLTKVHRQAQRSAILMESINIKKQKQIFEKDFYGKKILGALQDLTLDIHEDSENLSDKIISYFKQEYERVSNIMDVQIVVPMRERGELSVYALNNRIQAIVNPRQTNKIEIELSLKSGNKYIVREGDKVINRKNHYGIPDVNDIETNIFNGNIGIVKELVDTYMVVEFIGIGEVVIDKDKWKNIELGYVSTTHSYQGEQSKSIIVGLDMSAYVMLSKEWLYTAITRAMEQCILVAENRAVQMSINQSKTSVKMTFLKEFLINDVDKL